MAMAIAAAVFAGEAGVQGGEWGTTVARLKENTLRLRFRGALGERTGAGFFVDTNGWVLTNLSIAEGARQGYAETIGGEKLPVKRVLGVAPKYNLLLLDLGGERGGALNLAEEGTTRTGMEAHGIGMTRVQGWLDMAGNITGVGQTTDGLPLVEFSGWRNLETGGGPVADKEGRVHGISTWNMVKRVELDASGKHYATVPTERTGCLPASVMRRFVNSPHSGMALHELGACHANTEVANWVMFMCGEAKETLIALRDEVKAAGMEKRQIIEERNRNLRELYSHPIHWKNLDGILAASRKLVELNELAVRTMPSGWISDDRARNALRHFEEAMNAMKETVKLIVETDGMTPESFWMKFEYVKAKFDRANDSLFHALESAMAAYRMYGRYTTQSPWLSAIEAQRLAAFLEKRGGKF